MSIAKKLEEMSVTVEQLSAQVDDLKQDVTTVENSEYVEAMVAAVESIKNTIAVFKPYQH